MYNAPYGDTQQLNLDWFIKRWKEFYAEWEAAEAGIDHALDAEIQRVEDAMTDLYAARDAAAASATAAAGSASGASNNATIAANAATAAAASATLANSKAAAAGLSEANAANSANSASNSAIAAATSASQANASAASATTDAQSATASATAASNSAIAAAMSETNAAGSAADAEDSAQRAEDAAAAAQTGAVVKSVETVPIASVNDALAENIVELIVAIDPVQAGTGDPAPDNVRPITGWTGANIHRLGKNLLNSAFCTNRTQKGLTTTVNADGSISVTGTAEGTTRYWNAADTLNLTLPAGTYTLTPSSLRIEKVGGGNLQGTFTLAEDTTFKNVYFVYTNGQTVNETVYPQLELGSSTNYEPYSDTVFTVAFPITAGTVYGGNLTFRNGEWKLTVNKRMIDGGNVSWNKVINSQYRNFYTIVTSANSIEYIINIPTIISSIYKSESNNSASTTADNYVWVRTATEIAVKDTSKAELTEAEFQTAMSGVIFVYNLKTPIEYNLTETQALALLNGINNVWADTGNINLMRYFADSKSYIDAQDALVKALIAKELDNMIADTALTVNDFRIVNNTLYRITAPIANGAILTPNTNCTATTISEILKTLLT